MNSDRPQNKNLKPFKPGQSGNPSGRRKGLLSQSEVQDLMSRFCRMTKEQLQGVVQNPASTMIEIMVAAVMVRAAKDGDYSRFEFLLARSIGKVKDQKEDHDTTGEDDIKDVPDANLVHYLKQIKREA